MDMILRGINIRDHGFDGRVGIRQQPRAVATYGIEAINRTSEPKEVSVKLRNFRLQIRFIHSRRFGDIRHRGQHLANAGHPPATDIGFTEQDVSDDADHGQNDNYHDPRHPRSRFPVRSQNSPGNHAKLDQEVGPSPERSEYLIFSHSVDRLR